MWAWLLSFISGPLLGKIVDAYKIKVEAKTKGDAQAVELAVEEIKGEIAQRQIEAALIKAEQGWWITALVRPLMAAPFIIFAWKVVVWDKVMGWGVTDPLDPNMWSVFLTVVAAFFGGRTIEKVARIFKR